MIHLIELSLDGWLSYDKLRLSLQERGLTSILGKMGSGKSAILEAIVYLLTGRTIRQKESVQYLANKILDNGYDIAIHLSNDADDVVIQEVRGRTSSGLYFYVNGVDSRGKTDVETRKKILKVLGITPEAFKAISIIGQGQSQALVQGSATERAQVIVDIFNLTKYDSYIDECKKRIKSLEKEKDLAESVLSSKMEELSNSEDVLRDITLRVTACGKADRTQLSRYEKRLKELNNKYTKLIERKAKFNAEIYKINSYEVAAARISNLNIEIDKLVDQLVPLEDGPINKALSSLRTLETTTYANERQLRTLEGALKEAKTTTNICPINGEECPVNVPEEHKDATIAALSADLKELACVVSKSKKKIKKLQVYKDLVDKNTSIQSQIEQKEELMGASRALLPANWDVSDTTIFKRKVEKIEERLAAYKEKLSKLTDKISKLNKLEGEYASLRTTQQTLSARTDTLREDIRKLESAFIALEKQHATCAEAIVVFKKLKIIKVDAILQLLNKEASEILKKISDGKYNVKILSQKMSADNKRALDKVSIIVSDGYKELPATLWSGGQITEVSLALILGTWKTATRLSGTAMTSLWLDEVFGPIDQKAIDRVFESVVEVCSEERVTSVFIISHRDLDSRVFDHVLRATISNGISTLTID